MTDPSTASPFLRLPLELHYAIYNHLCSPEPRGYPTRAPTTITAASCSFSISPPSLLLTNRHFLNEVSTYYFTRCIFRFVAQSFRALNADKNYISAVSLHIVRNMRRVELLLLPGTMKAIPSDPWPSIMVKGMSPERLNEQVHLLKNKAKRLRTVVGSIRRVSWDHAWSMREMETLLKPLEGLKEKMEFKVGEVSGPSAIEGSMRIELVAVLGQLNS
ncbi:uncharacterized protein M421DRAFT_365365 [Didymella exigua CBS 183.55]|uniref:F-box domain-containing protein n=1 Tax=Didymella exigua CBS 183.55 TaxID=1150837 RepID=A0A6A5RU98_9PLEO|nr:uncharacterized protein M421DRAFT_365365 [Didymella exigua CBS 183.55]KAF1931053.1 hypothetical protein M421DRAFT_365365 [Didymella exigua CBS 183.55]